MSPSSEAAVVREVLAGLTAAIRDKDATRAVSAYDAGIVVYDLAPPLVQRAAAARDPGSLAEWFDTWDGPIDIEEVDLHVEVDGDLAVAWALRHLTGTKVEGGAQSLWYRSTAVLRRRSGIWRIVHMHDSVPFAMDGSGQALLDLKP